MKKLLILVVLACSTTIVTRAQELSFQSVEEKCATDFNHKGFHMGAGVGQNVTAIINQNSYKTPELEYRITYGNNYGIVAGYNFRHLGVQVETYYSKQGQKYEDEIIGSPTVSRRVLSHYIQVPVLLKYTGGGATVQFYAMAGPQFSVLSSSSVSFNGKEVTPFMINENVRETSFFEKYEWGIKMATGAEIRLTNKIYLNTGLAFYGGLSDMNIEAFRSNGNEFQAKPYHKSTNGYAGVNVGIHYMFRK